MVHENLPRKVNCMFAVNFTARGARSCSRRIKKFPVFSQALGITVVFPAARWSGNEREFRAGLNGFTQDFELLLADLLQFRACANDALGDGAHSLFPLRRVEFAKNRLRDDSPVGASNRLFAAQMMAN